MINFLKKLFLGNGAKIAGWLPVTAVKIVSVTAAATLITASGYVAVKTVMNQIQKQETGSSSSGLPFDENAQDGNVGKNKEEIKKQLDEQVEKSKFAISINTNPVFPTATEAGNLNIINAETNTYLMVVEIYTKDNQLVYKSGAIKPNQSIENAKLSKTLSKGEHEATAYFMAYTPDTQEYVGKAGAKVKINILN